jgi:hypothetical protein
MDGSDTRGAGRRTRPFWLILILLLVVVVGGGLWIYVARQRIKAAAQVTAVAKVLGISNQAARQFIDLGERFGGVDLEGLAITSLAMQLGSEENAPAFEEALEQVEEALAHSNVREDLSAPPAPTGDELFDRYALLVDQQINALGYEGIMEFDTAAVVSDDVLDQWEGEFGGDPRYWELRYFCMNYSVPAPSVLERAADPALRNQRGPQRDKALAFLEETRQRGIATANALMLLYWEKREALQHDNPPTREELVYPFEPEAAVELKAIADEAVAAGADQAWPYYTRALFWYETGEPERGLADMQAGNAQIHNRYPASFPLELVAKGLDAPAPAGNAAVSGAIIAAGLNVLPQPLIKKALKATLAENRQDNSSLAYETWHQFGCRFGNSRLEDLAFSLYGIGYVTRVRDAAVEDPALGPDDPRRKTLGHMLGAKEALLNTFKAHARDFDVFSVTQPLATAGQARGPCLVYYLDTSLREHAIATKTLSIFNELSEVRYPELKMTDALSKYENVTIEELKERREQRRAAEKQAEEAAGEGNGD